MAAPLLKKGDRIRLLVPLAISRWKGYGISKTDEYCRNPEGTVEFYREGNDPEETCLVLRYQVARCRNQRVSQKEAS